MLGSIDDISGAKRKENLTNHAGDARMSKELATIQVDVPVEIDVGSCAAQEPDRSQIRETFRIFELRDPLRRLEEARRGRCRTSGGVRVAIEVRGVQVAPAGCPSSATSARRWRRSGRSRSPAQGEGLPAEPETAPLRFAAYAGGGDVFVGEAEIARRDHDGLGRPGGRRA